MLYKFWDVFKQSHLLHLNNHSPHVLNELDKTALANVNSLFSELQRKQNLSNELIL